MEISQSGCRVTLVSITIDGSTHSLGVSANASANGTLSIPMTISNYDGGTLKHTPVFTLSGNTIKGVGDWTWTGSNDMTCLGTASYDLKRTVTSGTSFTTDTSVSESLTGSESKSNATNDETTATENNNSGLVYSCLDNATTLECMGMPKSEFHNLDDCKDKLSEYNVTSWASTKDNGNFYSGGFSLVGACVFPGVLSGG